MQRFLSLEYLKRAGARMGLGTDLLGSLHVRQSTEFTLRARVLPAIDVLRSACSVNAELLSQTGTLGCIRAGAMADILVVDGNPLEDISLLGSRRRSPFDHHEGGPFSQTYDLRIRRTHARDRRLGRNLSNRSWARSSVA